MATTVTAGPITIINSFITQPHTASAASPARPQPLEKFYKGEPLALGITQILVGAMQVAVGVIMAMVNSYLWIMALSVYVPIWSGLLYIISGSLSVAAAKNPKIPLVKGSLGMNIISSVLAGCAMILYLVSLLESRYQSRCDWYPEECTTYGIQQLPVGRREPWPSWWCCSCSPSWNSVSPSPLRPLGARPSAGTATAKCLWSFTRTWCLQIIQLLPPTPALTLLPALLPLTRTSPPHELFPRVATAWITSSLHTGPTCALPETKAAEWGLAIAPRSRHRAC